MAAGFFKSLLKSLTGALFWLAVWYIAAAAVDKELLLPSPVAVLKRLGELSLTADFYITTAFSVIRVVSGIALATALGLILSLITHVSRIADALIKPLITVIKATPVASFIILALVWISRDRLPIFIALLMVLPVVWTNLREGLNRIDPKLIEMAKVFKSTPWQTLKHIYMPSVLPYFTASMRTSLGLAWKAGIAAEVLALPKKAIGKQLFDSKSYLETTELFAWTVAVIILSLIIELAFEAVVKSYQRKRRAQDAEN